MFKKPLLISLFAVTSPLLAFASSPSNILDPIFGGHDATTQDLVSSSTVAVGEVDSASKPANPMTLECSGTVISKDLILTAAHCIYGFGEADSSLAFPVSFALNVNGAIPSGDLIVSRDVRVNPKYDGTSQDGNDVALIALSKPLPASYHPVPILSESYALKAGIEMILAGYGMTDTGSYGVLRVANVLLQDVEGAILVTDQTHGTGACNGDSGGPAYLQSGNQLYVYGITRGPHGDVDDCVHYGEYTYASKFQDFITQAAKDMKADLPVFASPQK